jgi:hypothetical protein
MGRRMKGIGDDGAVGKCERCLLIGRGPESKRHAPFSRSSRRWLSPGARLPVGAGGLAEVIRLDSRERRVKLRGNHGAVWSIGGFVRRVVNVGSISRPRASDSFNDHQRPRLELRRSRPEDVQKHGRRQRLVARRRWQPRQR